MPQADCTLPDYGKAVVRHALQWNFAAITFRRTLLSATETGYPLYLRLDRRPTGTFLECLPRRHSAIREALVRQGKLSFRLGIQSFD
jgi:hypothetical protein